MYIVFFRGSKCINWKIVNDWVDKYLIFDIKCFKLIVFNNNCIGVIVVIYVNGFNKWNFIILIIV